jgi:hypothetical protein
VAQKPLRAQEEKQRAEPAGTPAALAAIFPCLLRLPWC